MAVAKAIDALRPGLTQTEVKAILAPIRADFMNTRANQKGGEYLFRGTDEFVIVIMDGSDEDACVAQVRHMPDTGPFWDRMRRNWHARFR
jgi:hypothetical protein